jgi:hypothetical protein
MQDVELLEVEEMGGMVRGVVWEVRTSHCV